MRRTCNAFSLEDAKIAAVKERNLALLSLSASNVEKMAREEEEAAASPSQETVKANRFQLIFRTVPLTLCIVSMAVMLQNKQTNEYGTLHYTNVAAFKYLVYANGICAGYSLFSAIDYTLFAGLYSLTRAWVVFILDQVLTYVMFAAVAAGIEILFLAYQGNIKVTWSEVCVSYDKFCYRARASIFISSAAVVCFAVLSLASAYRLFSKYEPPVRNNDHENCSQG